MTITWWGQTCFRIESDGKALVINPPAKSSGLKRPRGIADAVLFSEDIPPKGDWDGIVSKETLVIDSPGEYDIGNFFIIGLAPNGGKKPSIFLVRCERKNICHIANYPHNELTDKDLEKLGDVDIALIPVGGNPKTKDVFNASQAAKITNQIEPNIVIPMRYAVPGAKENLESEKSFLKELGASDTEPQKKLIIKKNETLAKEETEVVVLNLS